MIKKLNKNRIWTERPLGKWYFDKETTDYLRISMQLLDIKMELRDLKNRVWIHVLRLRFAIANTKSFKLKTQLKFQEKIILEHIANIKKLKKENSEARRRNCEQEYGADTIFW
tara:strand:+ start:25 stop:363 length:339 start_codon:yes stop_codon:yes gene_type:complete